jgi:pyruvate,orthophosphate dikinase
MLLKLVLAPNLQFSTYPSIHNIGLTTTTMEGFGKNTGEKFAFGELHFVVRGVIELERKIKDAQGDEKSALELEKVSKSIVDKFDKWEKSSKTTPSDKELADLIAIGAKYSSEEIFHDPEKQLMHFMTKISELLAVEEGQDVGANEVALIVQPMVYGNFGKNSSSGQFFTRNVVTGEKKIMGSFYKGEFNEVGEGDDIHKLTKKHLDALIKMGETLETHHKEIRSLRFTIENDRLWLIDQRMVSDKSTRADIKLLLDLLSLKKIDESFIINSIKPSQLNELLHPVIKPSSVKSLLGLKGGISGAPGAAIGRIFYDTERLMAAHRQAQKAGEDTRMIFCKPATFADDVKATEISQGVLSSEGGYSAHASVVARQYGKVSLVKPDIKWGNKQITIDGKVIKEGDYVTLDVPYYGDPNLYIGKAELIESDPEQSGLLDFVAIVKKYLGDFKVRVNADAPDNAALALKFGAEGIGLCRTEHMFFDPSRINVFREMVLSDTTAERNKVLKKLGAMQKKDFYDLLKIMAGKEVTIRLLDAPLHEFLPHNKDEEKAYLDYINGKSKSPKMTAAELSKRTEDLHEFNPMLGHRGSRIAVSYPEIYAMQVRAIVEATIQLKKEKINVHPEIMLPLIMNENELKLLVYGKKIEGLSYTGVKDVIVDVCKENKSTVLDIKIGTMIEIPVAALGAGELAKYAQFFSFGTNDLTQTSLGLSRDDFNSFMPDYTQFDLLDGNPFKNLDPHVKELVQYGVKRGVMTRPDLSKGLCGEHGAVPENIEFCIETGLDYVSCSTYSVPIALLAVAQYNLKSS